MILTAYGGQSWILKYELSQSHIKNMIPWFHIVSNSSPYLPWNTCCHWDADLQHPHKSSACPRFASGIPWRCCRSTVLQYYRTTLTIFKNWFWFLWALCQTPHKPKSETQKWKQSTGMKLSTVETRAKFIWNYNLLKKKRTTNSI